MANHSLPSQKQTANASEASLSPSIAQRIFKVFGWQFWAAMVMVTFGVTGYAATSALLNLNTPQGCESIFWPLASGARRLYCAQVEAKAGDAKSLLNAIALVSKLPEDHPLRNEINKNIKVWSEEVLVLGEKKFQAGNLEAAIAIANDIPSGIAAKEVIAEKVERWRKIWEKGAAIEQEVEDHLNEAAWNLAFREAGRLVDLDNEYLANRRYTELVAKIQQAKIEGAVLQEAKDAFDQGGLENLLTALEKAQTIDADSYSYDGAQNLIQKVGDTLMTKAYDNLDQRRWNNVLEITRAIPESFGLEEEVTDLRQIALAGMEAQSGSIRGLKEAIAQAETIVEERPLHEKAQQLITRWEKEIEDVETLNLAKGHATGGTTADLRAAIATAQEVPSGNPRYQEARQLINNWTRRVQTIEDRPILNRAIEMARGRNISAYESAIAVAQQIKPNRALYQDAQNKIANWRDSIERIEDQPILNRATQLAYQGRLERAIATARQISPNRVLYREAQSKIATWQDRIERIEDQPILDEATELANEGRLERAIATAQQIKSNRALYREAQSRIQRWRTDLSARNSLREASQIAEVATVDALTRAIQNAASARNSNTYGDQAERLINEWSRRIYELALQRANENNFSTAIRIAQQI
ncbi:MAG: hypothetical protein GVY17_14535, partial [Cyanobacteria bacterium]|nr:hypothetical protein [Cyanobacteria bacterium GSL.Bin21]